MLIYFLKRVILCNLSLKCHHLSSFYTIKINVQNLYFFEKMKNKKFIVTKLKNIFKQPHAKLFLWSQTNNSIFFQDFFRDFIFGHLFLSIFKFPKKILKKVKLFVFDFVSLNSKI